MKKELIIALIILVLAATISYTDFTGFMTRDWQLYKTRGAPDVTKVEVSLNEVVAGEFIDIYITPGKSGAQDTLAIYRVGAKKMERVAGGHGSSGGGGTTTVGGNTGINWCGSQSICLEESKYDCTESFKCFGKRLYSYKTWSNWEGEYAVGIYDMKLKDIVYAPFTIKKNTTK